MNYRPFREVWWRFLIRNGCQIHCDVSNEIGWWSIQTLRYRPSSISQFRKIETKVPLSFVQSEKWMKLLNDLKTAGLFLCVLRFDISRQRFAESHSVQWLRYWIEFLSFNVVWRLCFIYVCFWFITYGHLWRNSVP